MNQKRMLWQLQADLKNQKYLIFSSAKILVAIGIETTLSNVAAFLQTIAPTLSIILIILGGIAYGLAQTQPPETRGKWQTTAIGLVVGGIIVAAIAGAAALIQETSSGLLT